MLKSNRSSHLAPLITRLQGWGYDISAVKPVAKVVEKLDSATLSLIERLVHDLTQLNGCSHDLRNQVNTLTGERDIEKQLLDRLRGENQRLLRENSELRAQVEKRVTPEIVAECQVSPSGQTGEEQVQQWRAQSIHQLQELEIMNQALRSTLNLQTFAPPTVDEKAAGQMTISKPLEPPAEPVSPPAPKPKSTSVENQKKLELIRVAETRCKKVEEELQKLKDGHSALQEQLASTKLEISSKNREIQELQSANRKALLNEAKEHLSVCKGISFLRSDLESIASELLFLQQIHEKEKEENRLSFPNTTLDPTCKQHIEYVLRESNLEQKVNSIKGFISNLDQKEKELVKDMNGLDTQLGLVDSERTQLRNLLDELSKDFPSGIMALAVIPEEMRRKHLERPSFPDEDKSSAVHQQRFTKMMLSIKGKESIQRSLEKVEQLKAKLDDLESAMVDHETTVEALRAELSKKNEQLGFITDEKVAGEEALAASQLECNQLATLIREIDGSMAQLTSALAARTVERDRTSQETEARITAEQEVQKKCNSLVRELEEIRWKYSQLQGDHSGCSRSREESSLKVADTTSQLQLCMRRLETAERDVEQLKTLITQLDSTREELVDKLKNTFADQQMAEQRVAAMDMEIRRLSQDYAERTGEVNHLCGLLDAVGKERDHLQIEASAQAERIIQMNDENGQLQTEMHFVKRNLQTAEHRLQSGQNLIQQAEAEIVSLKSQLSMEEDTKKNLDERLGTKTSQLNAIKDLLQVSNSDIQMLKTEILQVVAERENVLNELRDVNSKLQYCEQMLCVKEKEEGEIMKMCRDLSEENQQLRVQIVDRDNQLQSQRYQVQSLEEAFQRSQAQVKTLDDENLRFNSDLKALERQGDLMSRSLAQQSGLLNDYQNEKVALMGQLNAMKGATADLEAKNSAAKRDLAALEAKQQHVNDMFAESQKEREAITSRYEQEHERVRELEQLLTCLRAQEHHLELESKEAGTKIAMMRDRLISLEDQVQTLQITRDAQNQEIMRLQASLNTKETEERLRGRPVASSPSLSSHSMDMQFHQNAADIAGSKAKIHDLEMKNFSLTGDLSKTANLYKDCFSQLQKAETQNLEVRREYDHAISLLSKVDEDRVQLQRKCLELVAAADRAHQQKSCTPTHRDSKQADASRDIDALQKECHRLKQESNLTSTSSESSRLAGSWQ
nr:COP1-interactive protein 1-like isoform X2 [Physcomitrium patens]|eukprot:XP_024385381.1 COP1-interactive protein 1-like isoform X2 [Physcomitrella patens]